MTNKWSEIQFVIGLLCALTGAMLMLHGTVFGDNTTGIAIVLGICGITLISNSPKGLKKKTQ
jgi:ABC-type Mn2+/Zn2+ transport system permease subunit